MKPDWKDAPEWAKWLAMDSNGVWVRHKLKPVRLSGNWLSGSRTELVCISKDFENWKDSLEARPDDAPNPTP